MEQLGRSSDYFDTDGLGLPFKAEFMVRVEPLAESSTRVSVQSHRYEIRVGSKMVITHSGREAINKTVAASRWDEYRVILCVAACLGRREAVDCNVCASAYRSQERLAEELSRIRLSCPAKMMRLARLGVLVALGAMRRMTGPHVGVQLCTTPRARTESPAVRGRVGTTEEKRIPYLWDTDRQGRHLKFRDRWGRFLSPNRPETGARLARITLPVSEIFTLTAGAASSHKAILRPLHSGAGCLQTGASATARCPSRRKGDRMKLKVRIIKKPATNDQSKIAIVGIT